MTNLNHLGVLKRGVESWNKWRHENPHLEVDLSEADLSGLNLSRADFRTSVQYFNKPGKVNLHKAKLNGADLREANLIEADLRDADLREAKLNGAFLSGANLDNADLRGADLRGAQLWTTYLHCAKLNNADLTEAHLVEANLSHADLSGALLTDANLSKAILYTTELYKADLQRANLTRANLVKTKLGSTNLDGARVYGISAWDIETDNTIQNNLIITEEGKTKITVDRLEVAQFIYLLLNNANIRAVLNTIGQKGVLILGRFTPERKVILDAIRDKLRAYDFVPMMFDFDKPVQRDFTETIKTLAGLSRFIIADITNPKSSPLELQAVIPDYMIPLVPILDEKEEPFSMFRDLQNKYDDWVLDVLKYDSVENLIKVIEFAVIKPALEREGELLLKKAKVIRERHIKDFDKYLAST